MPLTAPPAAPPAPPTTPSRLDLENFDAEADAAWEYIFGDYWDFLVALRTWYDDYAEPELEALQADVAANQALAATSVTDAAAQVDLAEAQVALATTQATNAATSAASALSAADTNSTSTTAMTPGAGSKTITVQTGKNYVAGNWVNAAYTSDTAEFVSGRVVSYNSGTGELVIYGVLFAGVTSRSAWTVSKCGPVTLPNFSETHIASGVPAAMTLADLTARLYPPVIVATDTATDPSSITLTTSDGWTVSPALAASKMVSPTSIATAHGTWGSKTMAPPTTATITGSGTNTVLGAARLDTNLVVVLYRDGSNIMTVAINTATGAAGTPVTLCAYNSAVGAAIFAVSTTSYVAFGMHGASNTTINGGSVNTGTLAITQGSAQTTGTALFQTPVALSATTYAFVQNNASGLRICTVSGVTVTVGTAVAVGAFSETASGNVQIVRASATVLLIAYLTTGGGSGTTRGLSARTASISGTTPTLNAASAAATNVCSSDDLRLLLAFTEGTSYLAVARDGTVSTTGNYYGISVSGTTATVGLITARTTDVPVAYSPGTFIQAPSGKPAIRYNGTTALLGHLTTGPYAITISGTTLTFGSVLALAVATTFMFDGTNGTSCYAIGSTTMDQITVSGVVITSAFQVAASAATVIASDTVNNKTVKYGSTWYVWTMAPVAMVSPSYWLFDSGNNFLVAGPIN